MEKRVAKKVDDYIHNFKQEIKELILSLQIHEADGGKLLLQSIFDKPNLQLTQEDFVKRQRAKNIVNLQDRCTAKRASGELCSRKKKKDSPFCGTHCKGIPYGCVDDASQYNDTYCFDNNIPHHNTSQKIHIYTTEIDGIIYYIDDKRNAYSMEDIMNNIVNPHVIGSVSIDNKFTPTFSTTFSPLPIPHI